MSYELSFRMRSHAGPVTSGAFSGDPVVLKTAEKVAFLVHGFNVNEDDGRARLNLLQKRLNMSGEELAVSVLWPGDSPGGEILGAAAYHFQGQDADETGLRLAEYIAHNLTPGTKVSFVSHSLGARVVMETVKNLAGSKFPIGQVCLLAAAIDDCSLASPEDYRAAVRSADRVSVLYSKKDTVLKYAYPLGDFLQSFIFFWKDSAGLALGYHGPRPDEFSGNTVPGNVRPVEVPTDPPVGHSDYVSEYELKGHSITMAEGARAKKTARSEMMVRAEKTARAAAFVKQALSGEPEPAYEDIAGENP